MSVVVDPVADPVELRDHEEPLEEEPLELSVPDLTDEELSALALAADPDQVADADAEPWLGGRPGAVGLLPDWYMPGPVSRRREPWQVAVVVVIIAAFLLINALGLCITYGHLVPA
jgi:hypothetical protein